MRKIEYLSILILLSIQSLGQITIKDIEKETKNNKVLIPPQYNSLEKFRLFISSNKDPRYLGSEEEDNYYKQYIGLKVFYPTEENGDIGKGYYTIIKVLPKSSHNSNFFEYDDYPSLVIKNDSLGDTISVNSMDPHLIWVLYFMKQKQMFDGKSFIFYGAHTYPSSYLDLNTGNYIHPEYLSKWTCEVTVLDYNKILIDYIKNDYNITNYPPKGHNYIITYIFKNNDQELAFFDGGNESIECVNIIPYSTIKCWSTKINNCNEATFILTDVYTAKKKQTQVTKENYRQNCIIRFGQTFGELIAQGKVKIGMTTTMCKEAWGEPYDKSKTTTGSGVTEVWYYGWNKSLYFTNNILTRIEE
jgi:hypothetical protein